MNTYSVEKVYQIKGGNTTGRECAPWYSVQVQLETNVFQFSLCGIDDYSRHTHCRSCFRPPFRTVFNGLHLKKSNQPKSLIHNAAENPMGLGAARRSAFSRSEGVRRGLSRTDDLFGKGRRHPEPAPPTARHIARNVYVTRIETNKDGTKRPTFDAEMVQKTATLIKNTLDLPDVKSVQIDFDAVASERAFYRSMMIDLRKQTPEGVTLTMTSLASWCTGDAWFNDFPVDEAVPMAFQMGADEEKIKTYLRNGNDWNEPLCRGSYGISIDDPLKVELKPNRRTYYFSNNAWRASDIRASQP